MNGISQSAAIAHDLKALIASAIPILTRAAEGAGALELEIMGLEGELAAARAAPAVDPALTPPLAAPAAAAAPGAHPGFGDEGAFYQWLRENNMLGPVISGSEFAGCNAITRAAAAVRWPISYTAYALATAYLETAHTMQPVKEYGGPSYYFRMYDIGGARPAKAKELGNIHPGDGAKFCGRGYPQMTGRTNYAKADAKLHAMGILGPGESLVDNPEIAMRPDVAAAIMISGMGEGWFTGKKMSTYLPAQGKAAKKAFMDSRRIINGQDRAGDVADYALGFQEALSAGQWRF